MEAKFFRWGGGGGGWGGPTSLQTNRCSFEIRYVGVRNASFLPGRTFHGSKPFSFLGYSSITIIFIPGPKLVAESLTGLFPLLISYFFFASFLAGNILDSMLLKASNREAAGSGKESGGSAAPAPSAQRLLWCHCYHYCPEDSTNNTCR